MTALAEKECAACKGAAAALKGEALAGFSKQINSNWRIVNEHHLEREYKFANFREALAFTNRVRGIGRIAKSSSRYLSGLGQSEIDALDP